MKDKREVDEMNNLLKPMPGDAVRLTGGFMFAKPGAIGIIGGIVGQFEEDLHICFAYSAFRGGPYGGAIGRDYVSCSGGPATIATPVEELVYTGETMPISFWRWKDAPRAGGGVHYTLEVPVWDWKGKGESWQ